MIHTFNSAGCFDVTLEYTSSQGCISSLTQNNVVCANAGLAIATTNHMEHKKGFELAKESLLSGKGLKALQTIQELSK